MRGDAARSRPSAGDAPAGRAAGASQQGEGSGGTALEAAAVRAAEAALAATTAAAGSVAERRDRVRGAIGRHLATQAVLALANGFAGDHLHARHSRLSYPMTVRHDGAEVALSREALAAVHPAATSTVVVFVHGFVMSERGWWRRGREPHTRSTAYGQSLAEDLSMTPVWLRYNSGLRVSTNGALLDSLLGRLVRHWPVEVERLVLVGHSMGGLVIHSALAQADGSGGSGQWVSLVSDTVSLGTPHHGAPLEQAVAHAAVALGAWQRTAPVATAVRRRSVGTKDLRHGNLVPQDWLGHDPDDVRNRRIDIPLRPGIRHLAVVGVLGSDPDGWLGAALGDGMVTRTSARGQRRGYTGGQRYPDDDVVVLPAVNHLALLNHPQVYAVLRARLGEPG